jgi:hypothetical protein
MFTTAIPQSHFSLEPIDDQPKIRVVIRKRPINKK